MALMFLMYTVSNGGRTLLVERNQGTLPRLMFIRIGNFFNSEILGKATDVSWGVWFRLVDAV